MIDLFISSLSILTACAALAAVVRALAWAAPIDTARLTPEATPEATPAPVPEAAPVPEDRLPAHGFDYRGFWVYRSADAAGPFFRAIDNRPGLYIPRWYPPRHSSPVGILREVDRLLDRTPAR